jgi:serine/threonine protein kinase
LRLFPSIKDTLLTVEEGDESPYLLSSRGRNDDLRNKRDREANRKRNPIASRWGGLQLRIHAIKQLQLKPLLLSRSASAALEHSSLDPERLVVTRGLGCGGFGTVVEVMLPPAAGEDSPQTFYAMKVLDKGDIRGSKGRTARLREFRVLSISRHPSLLHCYLAFETPNTVNMVCDLVEGGDLAYHLSLLQNTQNQAGFKEHEAKSILAEVVMALDHLHRHNFIHRDLKIKNVMLDAKGHVKLIDFGLAFDLKSDTASHSPPISLLYLPPELRSSEHSHYQLRDRKFGRFTDWWAFGTLAFELLTGMCEWEDHDELSVRTMIKSMSQHRRVLNLSETAGPFVDRLLTSNCKERLGTSSSSEVMEDAFFEWVDWEAVDEGRATPRYVPDTKLFKRATEVKSDAALGKYKELHSVASLLHSTQKRTQQGKGKGKEGIRLKKVALEVGKRGYIGLKKVEMGPGFISAS